MSSGQQKHNVAVSPEGSSFLLSIGESSLVARGTLGIRAPPETISMHCFTAKRRQYSHPYPKMRPQTCPKKLVFGTRIETNNTNTSGVIHVGILTSPSIKWGFVLYVFTASIASSVNTHTLHIMLVVTFGGGSLESVPCSQYWGIHTENPPLDKCIYHSRYSRQSYCQISHNPSNATDINWESHGP